MDNFPNNQIGTRRFQKRVTARQEISTPTYIVPQENSAADQSLRRFQPPATALGAQPSFQSSEPVSRADSSGKIHRRTAKLYLADGRTLESHKNKRQQKKAQPNNSAQTPAAPSSAIANLVARSEDIILELPSLRPHTERSAPTAKPQQQDTLPAKPKSPAIFAPHIPNFPQRDTLLQEDECPFCHGAGYLRRDVPVGHPLFGKPIPCECKQRQLESKRREDLWRLSQLSAFQDMTFETFNPMVPGSMEAFRAARQYAEDLDGWLVLSGPCGSGKTHLAAAIANQQFQDGTLVLFTVVPHLLDHLRSTFAPQSNATYDELFDKVLNAGLLILDDLGAEYATSWAQEKLFQIINSRYIYQMPTVITTNVDLIQDLDDRIRSRLTDISLVKHVQLRAGDHRPMNPPKR